MDSLSPISRSGIDDVVIVGAGLAGLFCALRLAPRPITVISAGPIGEGTSSAWAQGGIAAAVGAGDSVEKHVADTLAAGAGIVDERIATLMAGQANARIHDLLAYGVPFDQDLAGRLLLSREAAHSERRIVRVRGDMAGKAIMAALVAVARATPSIRIIENHVGESVQSEGSRLIGLTIRHRAGLGLPFFVPAQAVVLATGGIGHLYAITTNPPEAEGSGLGMAARAGAVIADPEFVQFHPTALAVGRDPAPLATEALRGEGAWLVNEAGERFMPDVHKDAELAPRDIVARAIHRQLAAGHKVFLDCRASIGVAFAEKFPTVEAYCREAGIDPSRQPIPVAPAAHYHMGGVMVDANGRSTIDRLWACGETASTGAHGANRLASNSLLEAVVFAARIADDIKGQVLPTRSHALSLGEELPYAPQRADEAAIARLRQIMTAEVGVERNASGLALALEGIAELAEDCRQPRLLNMFAAAGMIAAAALARTESRGAHYRSDHPRTDPHWQHRTFLRQNDADRIASAARRERLELVSL